MASPRRAWIWLALGLLPDQPGPRHGRRAAVALLPGAGRPRAGRAGPAREVPLGGRPPLGPLRLREPGLEAWVYPLKVLDDFRLSFRLQGYPLEIDGPEVARLRSSVRPEATVLHLLACRLHGAADRVRSGRRARPRHAARDRQPVADDGDGALPASAPPDVAGGAHDRQRRVGREEPGLPDHGGDASGLSVSWAARERRTSRSCPTRRSRGTHPLRFEVEVSPGARAGAASSRS